MNEIMNGKIVSFQTDYGQKHGYVKGLITCITNGRIHAVVEEINQLPGIMHSVPTSELIVPQLQSF